MNRWVKRSILVGVGFLSVGVSYQAAQAKDDNPIGDTYSAETSPNLFKPTKVKANTETSFDIVLKPRCQQAMLQDALDVNTPGNPNFKKFLTPSAIRDKYGQSTSVTNSWKSYLAKHHLKSFVYDNGLLITVTGKVKYIDKTFKVDMNKATYHSNPLQFGKHAPAIPSDLANSVWTLLGMGTHNPKFVFPNASSAISKSVDNTYAFSGYTKQFVDHYNVQPLYDQGMTGKGQTVGIIGFGAIKKSNAYNFWKHEHASTDMSRYTVKNVPSTMMASNMVSKNDAEATMDVEYAGSVAPQANIRLYWSHNAIPTVMNMVNAYSTAFNENRVSSISSSWGLGSSSLLTMLKNRQVLSPDYLEVLDTILAQGALQGISDFSASGDYGSVPYQTTGVSGTHALRDRSANAVPPMESNPWVTSVGGTTLPFSKNFGTSHNPGSLPFGKVSVAKERSWGVDYLWPAFKNSGLLAQLPDLLSMTGAAGGGGFNKLVATPQYQEGVPGVNTFNARNYLSNLNQPMMDSDLLHGTSTGRNYPDVAADADEMTGYKIYYPVDTLKWVASGCTSIASPQMAAMAAVINSQPGRQRMGFWNGQIYKLAQQSNSPFHPMNDTTDNSNLYYTGQPGTVYNQASGLGTINFAKLAQVYQ